MAYPKWMARWQRARPLCWYPQYNNGAFTARCFNYQMQARHLMTEIDESTSSALYPDISGPTPCDAVSDHIPEAFTAAGGMGLWVDTGIEV